MHCFGKGVMLVLVAMACTQGRTHAQSLKDQHSMALRLRHDSMALLLRHQSMLAANLVNLQMALCLGAHHSRIYSRDGAGQRTSGTS